MMYYFGVRGTGVCLPLEETSLASREGPLILEGVSSVSEEGRDRLVGEALPSLLLDSCLFRAIVVH